MGVGCALPGCSAMWCQKNSVQCVNISVILGTCRVPQKIAPPNVAIRNASDVFWAYNEVRVVASPAVAAVPAACPPGSCYLFCTL